MEGISFTKKLKKQLFQKEMQASGKDAEEHRQKQLELEQRENVLYEQEVICEMEKAEVSDQRERNAQQEEENRIEREKVESEKEPA